MNKVVETDLTKLEADPSSRATVHPKLEKVKMGGKVPGGGTFTLVARVSPCSPLSAAMATLGLAIATCLVAGVAHAIGVPAMAAMITGLGASICIFVLVRVLSGRWTATPRR
jgi:hypothetical protein